MNLDETTLFSIKLKQVIPHTSKNIRTVFHRPRYLLSKNNSRACWRREPSSSPYSAPIVLQKKNDGGWRFCVDYRDFNDVTVKNAFPIPKIDQSFDALRRANFFSSLDLASGYWQVPVAPEDRHKKAFVTPDDGLYEYIKMPFGLSNAPGTFQKLMNNLFKDHL